MTEFVTVDEIPDTVPCDADIDNLQISVVDDSVSVIFYIAQHEGTDRDGIPNHRHYYHPTNKNYRPTKHQDPPYST